LFPSNDVNICSCGHHRALKVNARQIDPTRTKSLRDRFVADITRRFRKVNRLIRESVVKNDCFGIKNQPAALAATGVREFEFKRDDEKLAAFMAWLATQVQENIFEITTRDRIGESITGLWANLYIDTAYKQGIRRARQEARNSGLQVPDIGNEYIDEVNVSFNSPIHSERAAVIYSRVYSELEGVTAAMDQQISRILADGIIQGWGTERIAQEIAAKVEGIGITRALMIARTEVIRAHHLATIQEYRNLEIQGIKIQAEFSTAGDGRVCKVCAGLNGKIFSLNEAEGIIPVHPNCRCVCLPYIEE